MSIYKKDWKQVDSLINLRKPESAKNKVIEILKKAESNQESDEILKAKYWKTALETNRENSQEYIINTFETISNTVTNPVEKAFWQNRTANAYLAYFNNNQYNIYDRTNLDATKSTDIATWDARQFNNKICSLFLASISNRNILKNIPLEQYKTIIDFGENTLNLRPSLYDLLMWDAIHFFQNENIEITQPIYKFELDDEKYFSNANSFSQLNIQAKDSSSLKLKTIQLYQELLVHYQTSKNIDGLIDADLARLNFVYQFSTRPNKKTIYQDALYSLAKNFKANKNVAQALFLAAQLKLNENLEAQNYSELAINNQAQNSKDLVAIQTELQQIIHDYPNSEGAINAYNSIQNLIKTSLTVTVEDAYPPLEAAKFLLGYKNSNEVEICIYRTNILQIKNKKEIGKLVKTWQQQIPNAQDLKQHSVELKIDPLEAGLYWLVVKDVKQKVSTQTLLQISSLAAILPSGTNVNNKELLVLNRTSGFPVKNPQLLLINYNYQNNTGIYTGKIAGNIDGNVNGKILLSSISNRNDYPNYALVSGKDTLVLADNYYVFNSNDNYTKNDKIETSYRTFLFTDRSIYRPGQIIYFKGILLESKGNKIHHTASQKMVTVKFSDANDQSIKEVNVISNEYGSFSGSFIAPQSGLMGEMSITANYKDIYFNSTYINVEEYKRPKFYVNIDSLKDNFKINETITIKGNAIAYAGNNIQNAMVKYRIVRKVRFPYSWLWRGPISQGELEIKNDILQTDENGKFELQFQALPDNNIDPKSLPVFNFEINVDITDLNGETRSNTQNLSVGYQSMLLNIAAPDEVLASNFNNISINTTNLSGIFTPAPIQISIYSLQSPDRFYRNRLWATPTDFVMNEEAFRKDFPLDMYKEEWKPENRKQTGIVHQSKIMSVNGGTYNINPEWFTKSGYYKIEVTSQDKDGIEIKDQKYIFVYIPNQKQHDVPIFVGSNKNIYHPNENIQLFVHPANENINLLQFNSWNKLLNQNQQPIVLPVKEEDRGRCSMFWAFILNNRMYQKSYALTIPWDNKDLIIEWASHRDKVEPGTKEEWTLTIKGHLKEKVAAEIVAGLYDASLDALKPHQWNWEKLFSSDYFNINWFGFGLNNRSDAVYQDGNYKSGLEKQYPDFNLPSLLGIDNSRRYYKSARMYASASRLEDKAFEDAMPAPTLNAEVSADSAVGSIMGSGSISEKQNMGNEGSQLPSPIRTNFDENAFFMPQMQTDSEGNIKLKFTLPDALTEWKFMAFAHTQDWQTGYLSGSIQTQKELMVNPNLPRFFRQGDQIAIATKINNLGEKDLSGIAQIEILDAATLQNLNLAFGLKNNKQSFTIAALQSNAVMFNLSIPQARFEPVIIRITAKTDKFSDGEEHQIPVLTNRILVTETLPMQVRGNNTESFSFNKLLESNKSKSLLHQSLTLEFTGNPAWYAVQALPYLMEFPYECSEQIFSRFYANALAEHIVSQSPKIAQIFNQWRASDTSELLSNLEKNQELKMALLEETPWVLEAKNETQRKKNIALLFETHKLAKNLDKSLQKLSKLQNSNGSFSWFPGMKGDRYITQYILTGIAKLQSLNVNAAQGEEINNIQEKALAFLDQEILKDFRNIKKEHLKNNNLSYSQIQYLFMRSFLNAPVSKDVEIAYNYYTEQEQKFWNVQNNFMQGMIALNQYRKADAKLAITIMESLSERALHHKEMGMYWNKDFGYGWYNQSIETHSLLITAYAEIIKDQKMVDDLKVWLLKQKQTQDWKTTTATADACYALLKNGSDWLQSEPEVTIQLGNKNFNSKTEKTESGTGYFKQRIQGADIKPEMGNITVGIQNNNKKYSGIAWGAVYWQYFEDMDKITAASNESPLHIQKQLFIETPTDRGLVLKEITDSYPLKIDDKVKVRIVLKADRAMDYLHLKDMRAASFEPLNVLSGYKWSNNFGYYESTKDLASHFFIDHLPKGTFVFEYPLVVAQKGNFSNGITSIQCMYAPEFSSHTEGIRVEVK
ncbi:MAG TPA: alpha-2-macroglobulin family protein [Edaphocola sp.]|nr:alpha-2-macroglobulin family protein [Edaphocola sp.]